MILEIILCPDLVSSNNNVNILWSYNIPGNEDVFFRKSSSGGAGFGCTLNLNSIGDKSQINLAMAGEGIAFT